MHFNLKGIILAVTNRKYEILFMDSSGLIVNITQKSTGFSSVGVPSPPVRYSYCLAKQDKITFFRQVKLK